jgi:tRNA(fMet)-specific endonuclease VapC
MILIDTNVYSALENGRLSAVEVVRTESNICLPIVVVGELKFGFLKGNRTEINNQRLNVFLAQSYIEVMNPTLKSAEIYGELSLFAQKKGKALSNNDLWIAALAQEHNYRLATYDKDFEVFSELFGGKLLILDN